MTESEVEAVLKAEYKLLGQCDNFKEHFDAHAKECGVDGMPSQYLCN
jgi:hypothetical protein